jgi:orotidine-5'-phosphate decarboxylase
MTLPIHSFRGQGPVLCVGLDPSPAILQAWNLPDSPEGLSQFVAHASEAVVQSGVTVCKPQVAFFERHGVAGMRALAVLHGSLRAQGIYVIADTKRGDIGNSVEGYAQAWLTPGADFEADAMTLHPFHGTGSLTQAFERAHTHQKTVFVLAATSNPEASTVQSAITQSGETVSRSIVSDIVSYMQHNNLPDGVLGVVVGATVDQLALGLRLDQAPTLPILAPGYGAQGAKLSQVSDHFPHSDLVFPVSARALLDGGVEEFHARVHAALDQVATA